MKIFKTAILLFLLITAFWTGSLTGAKHAASGAASEKNSGNEQVKFWTCSMHPQIKLPKPGKCPLCGMDLIPLKSDTLSSDDNRPLIELSPYAEKLAEVRTLPVIRKFVSS